MCASDKRKEAVWAQMRFACCAAKRFSQTPKIKKIALQMKCCKSGVGLL